MKIQSFIEYFGGADSKVTFRVFYRDHVSKKIRQLDGKTVALQKLNWISDEWLLYPNGRLGIPIDIRNQPEGIETSVIMEISVGEILMKVPIPKLMNLVENSEWDHMERKTFAQLFMGA